MRAIFRQFPVFVHLCLMASASMAVPAAHAAVLEDWLIARTFLYHGLFFAILSIMLGLALAAGPRRGSAYDQLRILLLAYIVLPLILAAPLDYLVAPITFGQAYFEMLSSLTTTGATVFDDPDALAPTLHLWRATVGWMGGFMILLAALAILEPMQLGGFEIEAAISLGGPGGRRALSGPGADARERLIHHARAIAPPYVTLTVALAAALTVAGERELVAVCHAMSVLSTSGISPLAGLPASETGHAGEAIIFVFLMIALSHRATTFRFRRGGQGRGAIDPEYQLALICIGGITVLLFLRHFLGAIEVQEQENLAAAARAIWGTAFNALSFLSTTGFESQDWVDARRWSGLETPGIILLGLCLLGGGIATTTGGIKLLRVYALYKHGVREMQRLIHPHSVGGAGVTARRIRRQGASIAWIFLMLFLIGVAAVLLALTALGLPFEQALALSIASLSNTGPAAGLLTPDFSYARLDQAHRIVAGAAMIVGRLEILVLVSLFNPQAWRK